MKLNWNDLPFCYKLCNNLQVYRTLKDITYHVYGCKLKIIFPTKKNDCKKRRIYNE